MKQIMISAFASNSGKTVVTCALIKALLEKGFTVSSCKCGPDYIDPMFHRKVFNIKSYNLDLFLQSEEDVKSTLDNIDTDLTIIEGAMGFYDGVNGTCEASAFHVASSQDIPVVLVIKPKGNSITLAAMINGLVNFRANNNIVGIIFSDCSKSLCQHLMPVIESETGVKVLGFLPTMQEANFETRHLGLVLPNEVKDINERFSVLANALKQNCNIDALIELARERASHQPKPKTIKPLCKIAVAYDEAFNFYYQDSLEALQANGAELIFFSPLHDSKLPDEIDALYLGGGYPEVHARVLSENKTMLESIKLAITKGLPTIAECGGFMYLQKSIEGIDGIEYIMVNYFSGRVFKTKGLVRFGYAHLKVESDSMLFKSGESIPVHEFHHWDCDMNGDNLLAVKSSGKSWRCCYVSETLYAGFPHLHLAGKKSLAKRFVEAAIKFKTKRNDK